LPFDKTRHPLASFRFLAENKDILWGLVPATLLNPDAQLELCAGAGGGEPRVGIASALTVMPLWLRSRHWA